MRDQKMKKKEMRQEIIEEEERLEDGKKRQEIYPAMRDQYAETKMRILSLVSE